MTLQELLVFFFYFYYFVMYRTVANEEVEMKAFSPPNPISLNYGLNDSRSHMISLNTIRETQY